MKGYLIRFRETDEGTQGVFVSPFFTCCTLELPYRGNQPDISCIPEGDYQAVPHLWKGRIKSYLLKNVPDRTNILIHIGNFAGDMSKGYRSKSRGCILVGRYFGKLFGQLAVLRSRETLKELVSVFDFKPFKLIIKWYDFLEGLDGFNIEI